MRRLHGSESAKNRKRRRSSILMPLPIPRGRSCHPCHERNDHGGWSYAVGNTDTWLGGGDERKALLQISSGSYLIFRHTERNRVQSFWGNQNLDKMKALLYLLKEKPLRPHTLTSTQSKFSSRLKAASDRPDCRRCEKPDGRLVMRCRDLGHHQKVYRRGVGTGILPFQADPRTQISTSTYAAKCRRFNQIGRMKMAYAIIRTSLLAVHEGAIRGINCSGASQQNNPAKRPDLPCGWAIHRRMDDRSGSRFQGKLVGFPAHGILILK